MDTIKSLITNEKVKGALAIVAAIIMYYTPDHIDLIIETCLAAMGISKLTLEKK